MKTFASILGSLGLWGASQVMAQDPMPAWAAIHLYMLFAVMLEVSK